MEILGHDEFWAKCPAPGTKFIEFHGGCNVVIANEIDPATDEPDDITLVGVETAAVLGEGKVLVLSWGSWDDHPELLEKHGQAVESLQSEGYAHQCMLGI